MCSCDFIEEIQMYFSVIIIGEMYYLYVLMYEQYFLYFEILA